MPEPSLPSLAVFDLDGTLYDYDKANSKAKDVLLSEVSHYSHVSKEFASVIYTQARKNVKNRLGTTASSHNRIIYLAECFRLLNLRPNTRKFLELEESYWTTFFEEMELFCGVRELLQRLQNYGVLLALVTDLTSQIQYRKIEHLRLNGFFDQVITSEDVGGDKVSNLPFTFLSSHLTFTPSDTWFFGDSEFDMPSEWPGRILCFKKVVGRNTTQNNGVTYFEDYEWLNLSLSRGSI